MSVQLAVFLICNGFEPLSGAVLTRNFNRDMRKPRIGFRAVPVPNIRGDNNNLPWGKAYGWFSVLAVPTLARHTDKHLTAVLVRVVDMPVVAAAGFKCHIRENDRAFLTRVEHIQKRVSREVTRERVIWFALPENVQFIKLRFILNFHDFNGKFKTTQTLCVCVR